MATVDLYAELGLKPGATAKEIHSAYRKAAKRAHPDTGGSSEQFRKVSMAYAVLSDAARRAHYDKTGEIDEGRADNTLAQIMEVIASAFFQVLQDATSQGIDLRSLRYVDAMKALMRDQKGKIHKALVEKSDARSPLLVVRERFTVVDGCPDHIGNIIQSQINAIEAAEKIDKERIEIIDAAMQYMADVSYRSDPLQFVNVLGVGGFGAIGGGLGGPLG